MAPEMAVAMISVDAMCCIGSYLYGQSELFGLDLATGRRFFKADKTMSLIKDLSSYPNPSINEFSLQKVLG